MAALAEAENEEEEDGIVSERDQEDEDGLRALAALLNSALDDEKSS